MKSFVLVTLALTSLAHASGDKSNYQETRLAYQKANLTTHDLVGQHMGECFSKNYTYGKISYYKSEKAILIASLLNSKLIYLVYVAGGDRPDEEFVAYSDSHFDHDQYLVEPLESEEFGLGMRLAKYNLTYYLRQGRSGNFYLRAYDYETYCRFKKVTI